MLGALRQLKYFYFLSERHIHFRKPLNTEELNTINWEITC